jgi:two-component system, chemotaxis family, chemotaxis protein CheY
MKLGKQHNIILIADDDMFVRKMIKSGLFGMAEFIETANGADVEMLYKKHQPDMVFLDIHLPNISGVELIDKIRGSDEAAYVVMLSADSSLDNVKNTTNSGAVGFLTKPFSLARLQQYFHRCPTISFHDQAAQAMF